MTGIHSKAATQEYRDNWDRIFGKKKENVFGEGGLVDKHVREVCALPVPTAYQQKSCGNCAVDGQRCECEEAVCHVPDEAEGCLKELMAGTDMLETSEE